MDLAETYRYIHPAIVAFISTVTRSADGQNPHFPPVIGTGFFADERGIVVTNRHVIEALQALPHEVASHKSVARAIVSFGLRKRTDGGTRFPFGLVEIRLMDFLQQFKAPKDWYGERVPDIGFAQLEVTDVPALKLAEGDYYLEPGMSAATAGYPTGELFITVNDKVTQPFPTLRRGIVSSVFPFPCAAPHGFAMDIMQQGGASGSPVFRCDEPIVFGLVYGGFPKWNYSLAIPSHIVAGALRSFLKSQGLDFANVPTLKEIVASAEFRPEFEWEEFIKT